MPRPAKRSGPYIPEQTLVLDNGAYTMKAGFAAPEPDVTRDCSVIPNCIARESGKKHNVYIADELEECKDTGEMVFRRPLEKGFIVNWEAELDIWKQAFFKDGAKVLCDPRDANLILTEAPNCPLALQSHTDQMIFEEFEFAAAYRCLGASLNAYNDIPALTGNDALSEYPAECVLVVDSGYSHTTVTPLLRGRPVQSAIRRLEVGGKTLTNLLKELVSLRHWNLMDDTYLVSQIKEDSCFVSQDFNRDLETVWNLKSRSSKSGKKGSRTVAEYVLPDYRTTFRGHLRTTGDATEGTEQKETILPLGNERFVVPELLFNPSDIGMAQAGLAEIVVQSLSCLPPGTWPGMLANVLVVGGNAKIPGFLERFTNELRALTPSNCILQVRCAEDPITYTWMGGARLANQRDLLKSHLVTKQDYQEYGNAWVTRRFALGLRSGT